MASEDDDIALSLPQPPPPEPARRETAIQVAMRRFDAGGETSRIAFARPALRHAGSWWRGAMHPQLGALVAVLLVAVIGLPVAWLTIQRTRPATELASQNQTALKTFDAEATAPPEGTAVAPKVPTAVSEPQPAAPSAAAAGEDSATHTTEDAPLPEETVAKAETETQMPPSPPVAAPVPTLSGIRPEAPAAVAPQYGFAAGATSADPTIVTGSRTTRSRDRNVGDLGIDQGEARRVKSDRGDWNACTINDPQQSLAACKSLVNPSAKGIEGQAAASLADGLSLAWQGHIDRAIAAFDRAIAIDPASSLAYLNRGLAYQRQGASDQALADLNQAVRLTPNAARGYYNRSLLLRERGNVKRANADQARAINLNTDYRAVSIEQED